MRRSILIAAAVLILASVVYYLTNGGMVHAGYPQPQLPPQSWLLPFNINQRHMPAADAPDEESNISQRDINEFAWQSFIALNWPHKKGGARGEPDTLARLAPITTERLSEGPVVWETYRRPDEVFLPPSEWPVNWNDGGPLPLHPATGKRIIDVNSVNYSEFADGINQPYTNANFPTGPVPDQHGEYLRYEVAMNQAYFSYIAFFRYFNAGVQTRAVKNFIDYVSRNGSAPPPLRPGERARFFQPLPTGTDFYLRDSFDLPTYALQGMTEYKAAWKVLKTEGPDADVIGRFYRREVMFKEPDGSVSGPHLVGLVGLHIHRVTPFGHLPSTFEQIDNVELFPDGGPLPLPAHPNLNSGRNSATPPPYLNGYSINDSSGYSGIFPRPIPEGAALPPLDARPRVNVSRVTPIPEEIQAVNTIYREKLKGSVWYYYQLVGTQNRNLNRTPNPEIGPGILGAQSSNTQNLINTTLESYTQKGFSCARCHLNAYPHGVQMPFPTFEQKFKDLHVMSFLLLNAKFDSTEKRYE